MIELIHGDNIQALQALPANSVESAIIDPPYGLSDHSPDDVRACLTAWLSGAEYQHGKPGFLQRAWDSFVPGPELWREVLRVLKPGAHMAVFAGARTADLMGIALRLAGFELRDQIDWVQGQGFPHTLDISQAIDDFLGVARTEPIGRSDGKGYSSLQEQQREHGNRPYAAGLPSEHADRTVYAPATEPARRFDGWRSGLKPAHEPILLARKPLIGTIAKNVLAYTTGGLNIRACQVPTSEDLGRQNANAATWGTYGNGPNSQAGMPLEEQGRFPSNVLLCHAADCTPDQCGESCPVRMLDAQSGYTKSTRGKPRRGKPGNGWRMTHHGSEYTDQGGASRFFPVFWPDLELDAPFYYTAKANRAERDDGLDDLPDGTMQRVNPGGLEHDPRWGPVTAKNTHETVKPVSLLRWISKLLTYPGGTILDCCMGSGSMAVAAVLEGFSFIGIEQDATYVEVARRRAEKAQERLQDLDRRLIVDLAPEHRRALLKPGRNTGLRKKSPGPDQADMFLENLSNAESE